MKTDFKFSNLLGTVYGKGNLVFTPDGQSLLSPVGNLVSVFNLTTNSNYTLPFAHRKNITSIDLNPKGNLLLSVDEDGRAILTIFPRRLAIFHFSFKSPVSALAFAPSGKHFAVAIGRKIQVWKTPSTPDTNVNGEVDFAPFVLHREYGGHFDAIQSLVWSVDSRFFLSASKDLTARIWSLDPEEGFEPTVLAGHRESVKAAWFSANQESIFTISQDGALFRWEYVSAPQQNGDDEALVNIEDERWRIVQKDYFLQNAKVNCASFHPISKLLTVGFSNGLFGLYELPDFANIQTLNISQSDISHIATNKTGEWLAFGSSKHGQLLVWEWQSESYILKQQSHMDSLNTLAYSPDGTRIITGADDGKIKIWDLSSGFHIATFTEHSSGVTSCCYSKKGNVLFTASLDGSVRAWDMLRYRNFRTFTAPTRLSFSSVAIDPSGEVVCASSLDSFDIHVWSVQTGQLLDQLSGHEGPISSLAFTPDGQTLVSGSWDYTIRLWSIFQRTQVSEPLQLQSEVLSVSVRPDSSQLAASTLDGQLTFWTISTGTQSSVLDGRRDISGGRKLTDRRTAANNSSNKSFSSITYSADGSCLLAAGQSKYICLYAVSTLTLLKKFTVSINLSLSGTQEFLNSSAILSNGMPSTLLDEGGEASDLEDRIDRSLPGAKRGDATSRKQKHPEVRVTNVEFAPTGRSFCAASTEGLLIYSLDTNIPTFDPFDLDIDITPDTILSTLNEEKDYLKALVMAFRLNEISLIRKVYLSIPYNLIDTISRDIHHVYLTRLLRFIGTEMETSRHLELHLLWCKSLLSWHGRFIKDSSTGIVTGSGTGGVGTGEWAEVLRRLKRGIDGTAKTVRRIAEGNLENVDFLLEQAKIKKLESRNGVKTITNGESMDVDGETEGYTESGDVEKDGEDGWIGFD